MIWDLIGPEFGSRHHQYEMFSAGAPFLVTGRTFQNLDFGPAEHLVDDALVGYDISGRLPRDPAQSH